MQKIVFTPYSFWDSQTMKEGDNPTIEQWRNLENICDTLNKKYANENSCIIHPEQIHGLVVALNDGKIDIQIVKDHTCMCHDIVKRLEEIKNTENTII